MKHRTILSILWATGLSIVPVAAFSQPDVPAVLEQWRDWVLYGQEHRACPVRHGTQPGQVSSHICAWPGTLSIDVAGDGAAFDMRWTVYADSAVPLPGSAALWPVDVMVDGRSAAVVGRDGRPTVRLVPGEYRISGRLSWSVRPAAIPVPAEAGRVTLRLDGAVVAAPALEQGELWLGRRDADQVEQDRLTLSVYRLVTDTIPPALSTQLRLQVSGQARDVVLPDVLPEGFVGEYLNSPLPARLEPDGTLTLQLRPGSWELDLRAHASAFVDTIDVPQPEDPWPESEIWSFAAQPQLRVATLDGGSGVDPAQAGVPPAWSAYPAASVASGQMLMLAERSRNDGSEANRLSLERTLWLDFDGGAFTALDEISGTMRSRWRLDMAPPYTMTAAASQSVPLLVTAGQEPGVQGVELREQDLMLRVTARTPAGGALPVTGYLERFERVDTRLQLPPGYRLVAAPGADRSTNVWLDDWRLLDLFLVLIVTASVWRLFGARAGVLGLLAFVVIYHEPWAPRWAWLNLAVAAGLANVAPLGRLHTFAVRYRWLSVAAAALLLIPFTVVQLRAVIYPQLEQPVLTRAGEQLGGYRAAADVGLPEVGVSIRQPPSARVASERLDELVVTASSALTQAEQIALAPTRYAPGALVQTGPGLPDWSWNRYSLSWSGPIEPGQQHRLVVLAPWQLALWRIASVVLAWALFLVLTPVGIAAMRRFGRGAQLLVVGAVCLFSSAMPQPAQAQAQAAADIPSQEMLDELRNRLLAAAPCHPSCVELTRAAVTVDDRNLSMRLELALQDRVALPLPVHSGIWLPTSVRVDGADFAVLYRLREEPWIHLDAGVHVVELVGPVTSDDSFSLRFPVQPHSIDVVAAAWQSSGQSNGRLLAGSLDFVRVRQEEDDTLTLGASVFPPFVQVRRNIGFDLEWRVLTEVVRVAPLADAFTIELPLLAGESVLTSNLEVRDDNVLVAFAPGQRVATWVSQLPLSAELQLTAAEASAWSEVWRLSVSPIWHVAVEGVPSAPLDPSQSALLALEYFPRPGEALALDINRPAAAAGDTIAIDAVDYTVEVGERSLQSSLTFDYRSTQGGSHAIVLPEGSELDGVTIDGQAIPLRLEERRLELQKQPGEHHVELRWHASETPRAWLRVPVVDLGGGASNLRATVQMPSDRWVLLTSGPTLGPAMLYWSELLIFVLAALALGRMKFSPLRTHEWLLLGLGLSTFAWTVLFAFAAWVFLLKWRETAPAQSSDRAYNAVQVCLILLSILTLSSLIGAIPTGLLGQPEMQIRSPVGFAQLAWFEDRSAGPTPSIGVLSLSLWFYKAAMLAWALWLSFALLRWLRWGWSALTAHGLWHGKIVLPQRAK